MAINYDLTQKGQEVQEALDMVPDTISKKNGIDEEDLTAQNGKLRFKDKEFNASVFSGLGRKYLKKNIDTNGLLTKNILTQAMLDKANTIYHIQYDYDLDGGTVEVPEGCVLKFEGGSLRNGVLKGNSTVVEGGNYQIFSNITFTGKWAGTLNALWVGAKQNNEDYDNSAVLQNWFDSWCGCWNVLDFPNGTYWFKSPTCLDKNRRDFEIRGNNSKFCVSLPAGIDYEEEEEYSGSISGDGYQAFLYRNDGAIVKSLLSRTFIGLIGASLDSSNNGHFTLRDVLIENECMTGGNHISDTRCLWMRRMQQFCIMNVELRYFDVGVHLTDIWYGQFTGKTSLTRNRIGIYADNEIDDEVNTVDFHNIRIAGCTLEVAKSLYPQNAGESVENWEMRVACCGVDFHCNTNNCKFYGMVIEGCDYGIRFNSRRRYADGSSSGCVNIDSCYFENNRVWNIYLGDGYVVPVPLLNYTHRFLMVSQVNACLFHTNGGIFINRGVMHLSNCKGNSNITVTGKEDVKNNIPIVYFDGDYTLDGDGYFIRSGKSRSVYTVTNGNLGSTTVQRKLTYNLTSIQHGSWKRGYVQWPDGWVNVLTGYSMTVTSNNCYRLYPLECNIHAVPQASLQQYIQPLHVKHVNGKGYVTVNVGSKQYDALISTGIAQTLFTLNDSGIDLSTFMSLWNSGTKYTGKVRQVFKDEIVADPVLGIVTTKTGTRTLGTLLGFGKNAIENIFRDDSVPMEAPPTYTDEEWELLTDEEKTAYYKNVVKRRVCINGATYLINIDTLCLCILQGGTSSNPTNIVTSSQSANARVKFLCDLVQCGRTYDESLPQIFNDDGTSNSEGRTSTLRSFLGWEGTQMNSRRKQVNAIFYDLTESKYKIFNGQEWVNLTKGNQRFISKDCGLSKSERPSAGEFDGQTFFNYATGITYTYTMANSRHTSSKWIGSIGNVASLEQTNTGGSYDEELDENEVVMCNGSFYKWNGESFEALNPTV